MAKLDYTDSDVIDAYKLLVGENSDPEVVVSSSEKRSRSSLLDFTEFLFQTGVSNSVSAQDIRALFHILIKSIPNEIDDQTNVKALANEAAIAVINGSSSISGSISSAIADLRANVGSEYDTLYKIANKIIAQQTSLDGKVDVVSGMGLSENDFTDTLKTKLDGIDASATSNDTDANLKNRANHTGSQAIGSVTNLQTSLDAKATQTEVDAIETGSGLSATGTYIANTSADYIDDATSLKDADDKLDAQVKSNADSISTNATALTGKVDDSQVLTDVPSGAVFTDTQLTTEQIQDKVADFISASGASSITYDDSANTLVISSTDTNTETTTSLVQNSNVITYTNELGVSNDINLASGGEVNTGSNLGTGSEVFKAKSGVDLQFRKLTAGNNVTIVENTNDISISSTGGGGATNLSVTANGTSLTVESSTGTNVSLPLADSDNWGVTSDEMFDNNTASYTHSQAAHAPSNAEANVQSDWDATSGDAQILNKPTTISSGQASAITANTAKVTNATHTGDVTGSAALTIADNAVTYAKMQDVSATDRVLGRDSAGSGVVEEISPANLRTMLNVEDGAQVNPTLPTLIDDDTFTTGVSATSVASSESIKQYVDSSTITPVLTENLSYVFTLSETKTLSFQNKGHFFYPTHTLTNIPTGYSLGSKTWTSPTDMSFSVTAPSTVTSINNGITLSSHTAPNNQTYTISFSTRDYNSVGDIAHGGIVYYVAPDSNGNPTDHGLVIAMQDFYVSWGCYNVNVSGAVTTGIGTWDSNGDYSGGGKTNTAAISAATCSGTSGMMIHALDDYNDSENSANNGGYTDWFIPSKDELHEIYENLVNTANNPPDLSNVSGFTPINSSRHNSSTQFSNTYVWGEWLVNGNQTNGSAKNASNRLRVIRAY